MRTKAVTAKQKAAATGLTRLQAALRPDPGLPRVGRDNAILLRLAPLIVLPFAGAAVLALHPPTIPTAGARPEAWLDLVFFCAAGLAIVCGFAFGANSVLKSWGRSAPESAGTVLREFYRVVLGGKPSARRLEQLLATFSEPGPRVQPVFSWLSAGAVSALDSPKAVARYWHALVRGNRAIVRNCRLGEIEIELPVADVGVATVRMQVVVTRRLQSGIAAAVGMLIAVSPFFARPERIEPLGVSFWTCVAAAGALGFTIGWLLRKLLRAVVERREVAVRKIVVRQAHNWRLVSGEWETQDEADTSWLDPAALK